PPAAPLRAGPTLILVLDADVLRKSVLADLAERHFAGLDAEVAIVSREEPARVVWTSRPGFPEAGQRPDVTLPLLGAPPAGGGRRAGGGEFRFGGAPWARSAGAPAGGDRSSGWQLVVAHRDGSLAAVVSRTRLRNLGVGLGALALLGGSAALLVYSGHRARALAQQQMAFVAAVSHELRTPLAAIRSAGENLADGVVTDPEQVK